VAGLRGDGTGGTNEEVDGGLLGHPDADLGRLREDAVV
jgi:hypothetical protein